MDICVICNTSTKERCEAETRIIQYLNAYPIAQYIKLGDVHIREVIISFSGWGWGGMGRGTLIDTRSPKGGREDKVSWKRNVPNLEYS